MNGTFAATSFEVEAERRREVLAASMRSARGSERPETRASRPPHRGPNGSWVHRLGAVLRGARSSVGQRA